VKSPATRASTFPFAVGPFSSYGKALKTASAISPQRMSAKARPELTATAISANRFVHALLPAGRHDGGLRAEERHMDENYGASVLALRVDFAATTRVRVPRG
jgi:hypothetical protein